MSNTNVIIFVAIEEQEFEKLDLILPMTDWTIDLGNMLQQAYENRSESGLCIVSGRGKPLNDILNIQQHYNLTSLNFINYECSTLQGLEVASAIKSLTNVIDELLNENLDFISSSGNYFKYNVHS